MTYATNLGQIIASLETILDRLRTAAPLDFPDTAVSFDWQITSHRTPEDVRVSAVTELCRRLLDIEPDGRTGGQAFGSPLFGIDVGHVNVDIWTSVQSDRERKLAGENERLRARLAELEAEPRCEDTAAPAVEQDPDALDQLAVAATDATVDVVTAAGLQVVSGPGPLVDVLAEALPKLAAAKRAAAEPAIGPDTEIDWYFTFGSGHEFDGRYVLINGTCDDARAAMFEHFGNRWSHQYASAEAAGVDRYGMVLLPASEWPTPDEGVEYDADGDRIADGSATSGLSS